MVGRITVVSELGLTAVEVGVAVCVSRWWSVALSQNLKTECGVVRRRKAGVAVSTFGGRCEYVRVSSPFLLEPTSLSKDAACSRYRHTLRLPVVVGIFVPKPKTQKLKTECGLVRRRKAGVAVSAFGGRCEYVRVRSPFLLEPTQTAPLKWG